MTARIGLPHHGIVTQSQLQRPPLEVLPYPQPVGGHTVLVRHPFAVVQARTPAEIVWDDSQGYQWRDYAILSGNGRQIGGQDLGTGANNRWLYCDATGATWVMDLTLTEAAGSADELRLDVILVRRFGLMRDTAAPAVNRNLANQTFIPDLHNPVLATGLDLFVSPSRSAYLVGSGRRSTVPTETGEKALFHVAANVTDPVTGEEVPRLLHFGDDPTVLRQTAALAEVWEVAVSGAAATINDVTGASITATLTRIGSGAAYHSVTVLPDVSPAVKGEVFRGFTCEQTAPDLYVATPNPPDGPKNGNDGFEYVFTLGAYYTAAGSIAYVVRTTTNLTSYAQSLSNGGTVEWTTASGPEPPFTDEECGTIVQNGHAQGGNTTFFIDDWTQTELLAEVLSVGGVDVIGWSRERVNTIDLNVSGEIPPFDSFVVATETDTLGGPDPDFFGRTFAPVTQHTNNLISGGTGNIAELPGFARLIGLPDGSLEKELTGGAQVTFINASMQPSTNEIQVDGPTAICWV